MSPVESGGVWLSPVESGGESCYTVDEGYLVDVIYLDFQQAFDKVPDK